MSFIRAHKIEIGIFILALAVRFLYLGLSYMAADGNLIAVLNRGDGYFDIAQNIISGHGYSIAQEVPYTPTSYRTPVMPYFIALSYALLGSFGAVVGVQIILGSIIPLLGMSLARYITNRRAITIAVGVFLALEPTSVLFSTVLLSEIVFTFVFLLSLLYLFRYWKEKTLAPLLISAFLLGISTLVRPTVEYLPLIIITLILFEARPYFSRIILLRTGLYALVFLLTLSPWIYRNYQTFGVAALSSQQGAALYAVTVPSVLAIERGTSFAQEYNTQIAGPNDANFVQSAEYTKLAVPILLAHPRALALMSINTATSFFIYDGAYDVLRQVGLEGDMFATLSRAKQESGVQPSTPTLLLLSQPLVLARFLAELAMTPLVFVLLGRVAWLIITCAFFAGVWRYLRHANGTVIYAKTAVAVVLYLMLTTILVGFTVNYRYRLPVNVFIATFAAYEVAALAPWFSRRFRTRVA
jgi:4-amino-4-deoxy-L-arabinose transferase-like glycosyltransferase